MLKKKKKKLPKEKILELLGKEKKLHSYLNEEDYLPILAYDEDYQKLINLTPKGLHNNKSGFDIVKILLDKVLVEIGVEGYSVLFLTKQELLEGQYEKEIKDADKVVLLNGENNVELSVLFSNIFVPLHKLLCITELALRNNLQKNATKADYEISNYFQQLLDPEFSLEETINLSHEILSKNGFKTKEEIEILLEKNNLQSYNLMPKDSYVRFVNDWFGKISIKEKLKLTKAKKIGLTVLYITVILSISKGLSLYLTDSLRHILKHFGYSTKFISYNTLETSLEPLFFLLFSIFLFLVTSVGYTTRTLKKLFKNTKGKVAQ